MKNAFLISALLLLIACEREQVQLKPFANTKWTLTAIQNTSTNSIIYYPETLTKESIVFVDSISTLQGTGVCNGCGGTYTCLLYTSPSPRDRTRYRMPSS